MYTWIAYYTDGTQLSEIEADGTEHGAGDIDFSKVCTVHVIPKVQNLPAHVIELHPPDERLIGFARRIIKIADGVGEERSTIWVFGWQRTDGGRNTKTLMFIYPDGSCRLSSEDN